ncbi:MAG: hypothetical protein LBP35_04560 [Candidatus Ancillula trichonymphae]|nr:hypothetical protein [Candidatus Ancillula trichonymphae]
MIDDDIDVNDIAFESGGTSFQPCSTEYKDKYAEVLKFINSKVSPVGAKVTISGVLPYTGNHKDRAYSDSYTMLNNYVKNHPHWMFINNEQILCTEEQIKKGDTYCNAKTSHGSNIFQADMAHFSTDAYLTMGSIYVDLVQGFLKKRAKV